MDNKKNLVEFSHSVELDNVQFESHGYVAHHAQLTDCRVGDYSSIGRFTKVRCADIGRYCSISWDCTIGAVAHPLTKISTSAIYYRAEYGLIDEDILFPQKRTVLGNDVWIGCNVVIKSGVTIGNGAVVGAGSVCTHDVDPYTIVAGNPARVLRTRISPNLIARVNALEWWYWDLADKKKCKNLFESDFSESVLIELEEYKEKFIDLKNTRNIEYIKLSSLEGGVATSNLIKNFVQLIDDLRSNRVNTVYIYCANNIGSFAATNLKKIGFKVEFIFDKDSNKYGVYKDFLVCKLKSSVILDNSSIVICTDKYFMEIQAELLNKINSKNISIFCLSQN